MTKRSHRSFVNCRVDLVVVAKGILHRQLDLKRVRPRNLNRVLCLDSQQPELITLRCRWRRRCRQEENKNETCDDLILARQFLHAQDSGVLLLPRWSGDIWIMNNGEDHIQSIRVQQLRKRSTKPKTYLTDN